MRPTSPTGDARRGARGFTLVETLVVMALFALALGLATPRLTRLGGLGAAAAAEEVSALLRDARLTARRDMRIVAVTIDAEARMIAIEGGATLTLPARIRIEALVAANERTGLRSGRIHFFPDGAATGGRVTVRAGGRALDVGVDWLGGAVEVRDAPGT